MNFTKTTTAFLRLATLTLLGAVFVWSAAAQRVDTEQAEAFATKWSKASVAELTTALNRLADHSIQRMYAVTARTKALDAAWLDPTNTSEEIEALRVLARELEAELQTARKAVRDDEEDDVLVDRVQDLEKELQTTRTALRDAVEALPAVKAKLDALHKEQRVIDLLEVERKVVEAQLVQRRSGS